MRVRITSIAFPLSDTGANMIRTFSLGVAAAFALTASPAFAQDEEDDRPLIVSFGAGPQLVPEYPGADDYGIGPLFGGHVRREGDPIPTSTPDDGFGISLIGRNAPIDFGPVVHVLGKREDEDVGAPVGDVDLTIEPGLFVNFNISPRFRVRLEGRRAVGGAEGWTGDAGADFILKSGLDTMFTIGPRVRLSDEDHMNAYFGVSPAAALLSGIPAYAPGGGVRAIGAVAGITHQISRSFGVYAYAGYDRLVGDAADSPIVTRFGSENQFSGGIALYYSFRMRNPF